jgi:hypothetical protein
MIEKGLDVVEERVDREVAPEGVLLGRAEGVVAVNQAIARVVELRRRHVAFGGASVCNGLSAAAPRLRPGAGRWPLRSSSSPKRHVRQTEAPADDPAVAEELLDLVGLRRGADVEVLRLAAQEQVAHAAADQVRRVVGLIEPVENFQGFWIDELARQHVLGSRHDLRVAHRIGIVAKR